jgi:aldehyde:ferredoxin oxidoreductase
MLNGGYMGRILRIDLSTQSAHTEALREAEVKALLGGRGLAAKYYYDEIGPEVEPLSAENKLIFMTGPVTGVRLPTSTKFQLATKSPATGIYLCTNSSGEFGPYLKRAGFDGLIVEGRAAEWTYVSIVDDRVTFLDATALIGTGTSECQRALKEKAKKDDSAGAGGSKALSAASLSVGPAGERAVALSCIGVDERFFGRGGPGAVMGWKRLKGIVVQGSGAIPVADEAAVKEIYRAAAANLKDSRASHTEYGTVQFVESLNELGCLPTRNFQTSYFEAADKIDAHAMVEGYTVKNSACYMCPIACGKVNEVREGPFAGSRARTEYETVAMLGSNCGIDDFGAIVRAAELCDELGIDTISTGSAIALTMELFEKGLITSKDTEGVEARFGNAEALVALVRLIAEQRGIGALLAEGMGSVQRRRPEWKPYILAVKGQSFSAYEPRGFHGKALSFGTASRGACHSVGGWTVRHELFSKDYDRFATKGKGKLVKTVQDNRAYVDSLGVCTVARSSMGFSDNPSGEALEAVTGWGFTPRLLEIGERIYNLERVILNREGIRRADDQIPERIMNDPIQSGPIQGRRITREMYNEMLDEYYSERGWDADGVVREETLRRLGLAELLGRAVTGTTGLRQARRGAAGEAAGGLQ